MIMNDNDNELRLFIQTRGGGAPIGQDAYITQ